MRDKSLHKNAELKLRNRNLRIENDKLRRILKTFSDMMVECGYEKEEVKMMKKENEKDMDDNVIDFGQAKLLKAGGSEPPSGKNWLRDLEPGWTFVVGRKSHPGQPLDPMCMEYTVVEHGEKTTLLYSDLNPPPMYLRVYTEPFSNTTIMLELNKIRKNVID